MAEVRSHLKSIFVGGKQMRKGEIIAYNISRSGILNFLPDRYYLGIMYWLHTGKLLNLNNPQTLNEKLQWLKINNRDQRYIKMVDKYAVRDYVKRTIGADYLIPILGKWERGEDIDWEALPRQFVLKCNHDSHSIVICKDKEIIDKKAIIDKLNKHLKQNMYYVAREWPYKNVKPCIIAEKYMVDYENDENSELTDYKFYCFGKNVDSVMVCTDRNTGSPKFYFFDRKWNLKRYNKRGKAAPEGFTIPKPQNMDKMFEIAEVFAKDIMAPYLRVDLYNCNGHVYFGELTFFPDGGFDPNRLPETDLLFGNMTDLSLVKKADI